MYIVSQFVIRICIKNFQVQLLFDLASAGIGTCYKVLESFEIQKSLLFAEVTSLIQHGDVLRSLATNQSASANVNNAQMGLASSSSQWEPGDHLPQTITGTSEASVSRLVKYLLF